MSKDPAARAQSGVVAWLRTHAVALIASLIVALGFAWLLHAGALPVVPPREAWRTVQPAVVAGYVAMFIVVHIVRCARWGLLVSPGMRPTFAQSLWIGLLGYGALVLLPFRLGEAVRPALLHSRAKLALGTSAGVMAAERIVDGLVISSMLLVALLGATRISPLPDHIGELPIPASVIPSLAWGAVIVFGLLSLAMVAFYLWQRPICRLVERYLGRFSPALASRAARAVASVANGFRFLEDARTAPLFGLCTCLYWALNATGVWVLLCGAGLPSPSLAEASVILGVLGLGLVVPNAPGFFGTFQIAAYSAMVLFYPLVVVTQAGAAFVFLLYAIQMSVILGGAGIALAWGWRRVEVGATLHGIDAG